MKIRASGKIEPQESEEEAIDKFEANCPYDIDGNTIECEEDKESEDRG